MLDAPIPVDAFASTTHKEVIRMGMTNKRPRSRRAELASLSLEDLESRTLLSGNAFTRFEHSVTAEWHKMIGTGKPHHHVFGINLHMPHHQGHVHKP